MTVVEKEETKMAADCGPQFVDHRAVSQHKSGNMICTTIQGEQYDIL